MRKGLVFLLLLPFVATGLRNAHSTTSSLSVPLIRAHTQCPMLHTTAYSTPHPYLTATLLVSFLLGRTPRQAQGWTVSFLVLMQSMHTRRCRRVSEAASFVSFRFFLVFRLRLHSPSAVPNRSPAYTFCYLHMIPVRGAGL